MTTGPIRLKPDDPDELPAVERLDPRSGASARGGTLRWLLPLAIVAFALGIFWLLVATREPPKTSDPRVPSPLVRVVEVQPEDVRLSVIARGTVIPRTESDLVAEVRGRVVESSPQLVEGGFFSKGDVLLELDDREYRIALSRARATVKLRESEARLAEAEARRRRELASRGAASAADLEQVESRALVADAALQEAKAARQQAALDLERTVVRAPFDGRVRERDVDVGQFVAPGEKLARIFAVDYSEVRLPVRTDELAYLGGTFDFAGGNGGFEGAPVSLTARLGGRDLTWTARIVRAEAAIDARTRMLNLVARVDDPYGLAEADRPGGDPGGTEPETAASAAAVAPPREERAGGVRMPLPPGLFVTAEISGRALGGVYVLPPMALRDADQVFVLDADSRLRVRDVSVVRHDRDRVIIDGGLEPGERVVVSPLRIYSEGMELRALEASGS